MRHARTVTSTLSALSTSRIGQREPRLRSHLEAVAASHSTYGTIAANVAFVVSRSTESLHPDGYQTGCSTERAWQLDRLLDRVGLH